jgi:hypothetical protein
LLVESGGGTPSSRPVTILVEGVGDTVVIYRT